MALLLVSGADEVDLMVYKLDDDWDNDPRVSRAGTAAFGLYSRCGMWVARQLTDGFVPSEIAAGYGTTEWAAKLVAVGLWERTEGGFMMPDYLIRNDTAETARRKRKQAAARQERWRQNRAAREQQETRDERVSNASRNAAPSPPLKGKGAAAKRAAAPPHPFDDDGDGNCTRCRLPESNKRMHR